MNYAYKKVRDLLFKVACVFYAAKPIYVVNTNSHKSINITESVLIEIPNLNARRDCLCLASKGYPVKVGGFTFFVFATLLNIISINTFSNNLSDWPVNASH